MKIKLEYFRGYVIVIEKGCVQIEYYLTQPFVWR